MRLLLILISLLILMPDADAARWRWPWEVQRTRHHHPRHRVKVPPPPNCVQINEAVKALDAEHLQRALRYSTKGQRRIITACAAKRD